MAEITPLETKISAVTVFVQQARVTRQGKITLAAGEHLLSLNNLPNTLEEDSVRVSGRGAGVTLLSVDVKKEFLTESTLAALETLKQRQQEIETTIQALNDDKTALEAHYEFVRLLSQRSGERLATSLATDKMTVDQANNLSAYLFAQIQQRYQRQTAINQQLQDHHRNLNILKQQMQEMGQAKNTTSYQVRIAVRVENQIEAEFDIDYIVKGASWTPFYDVRLLADQNIELTYFADVMQRSGEDWQNVNLALSTARPSKTATLPELKTWFLPQEVIHPPTNRPRLHVAQEVDVLASVSDFDFDDSRGGDTEDGDPFSSGEYDDGILDEAPASKSIGWFQAATRRAAKQDRQVMGGESDLRPQTSSVNQASSGGALTYLIRTPTDIPSDGTPHKTTVAVLTISAKLDYLTIPKIAPEAYLRATITNTSDYTLLPGTISIFHGEDFIGKTRIALVAANEDFKVQLGVEERIKVERKLMKREVSKRLIGNSRLVSYSYQIKVTNLLPDAAKVTVSDQIPVTRRENLKILNTQFIPEPSEKTELGILTWTFDVAANANQTLQFDFTVEHPRDMTVVGLEE